MISALVLADDASFPQPASADAVVRTLSALIPATIEGLIRDVAVTGLDGRRETRHRDIADQPLNGRRNERRQSAHHRIRRSGLRKRSVICKHQG